MTLASAQDRSCACGEELLLDHEIESGKCLTCMMIEFQNAEESE